MLSRRRSEGQSALSTSSEGQSSRAQQGAGATRLIGAYLACVGFLVVPLTARGAQVLDVRVGEHPDFTRLVFEFDQTPTYFVERGADGKSLSVRLDAHAATEQFSGYGRWIESVELETTDYGTIARIRLSGNDADIEEQVLSAPPRIVLDIRGPESGLPTSGAPPEKAPENPATSAQSSDAGLSGYELREAEESEDGPVAKAVTISGPVSSEPGSSPLASENVPAPADSADLVPLEVESGERGVLVDAAVARNPDASETGSTASPASGRVGKPKWSLLPLTVAALLALGLVTLRSRRRARSLAAFEERDAALPAAAQEAEPSWADFGFSDVADPDDPLRLEPAHQDHGDEQPPARNEDPPVGTATERDRESDRPRPRRPSGATTMASMSLER